MRKKKTSSGSVRKRRVDDEDSESEFLFDQTPSGDDEDDDISRLEDDVTDIDVLDLGLDAIQELLPYLEQCEKEGRTLADVIGEFWEVVSE